MLKHVFIAILLAGGCTFFLKSCQAARRFIDEDICYDFGGYVDGDYCVTKDGREKL